MELVSSSVKWKIRIWYVSIFPRSSFILSVISKWYSQVSSAHSSDCDFTQLTIIEFRVHILFYPLGRLLDLFVSSVFDFHHSTHPTCNGPLFWSDSMTRPNYAWKSRGTRPSCLSFIWMKNLILILLKYLHFPEIVQILYWNLLRDQQKITLFVQRWPHFAVLSFEDASIDFVSIRYLMYILFSS